MDVPERLAYTSTVIPVPTLASPAARRALDTAVAALAVMPNTRVLLDLSAVNELDADGVAVLLACSRTLTEQGGRLALTNVSNRLRVLFELTRLQLLFPEVAALASPSSRRRKTSAMAA